MLSWPNLSTNSLAPLLAWEKSLPCRAVTFYLLSFHSDFSFPQWFLNSRKLRVDKHINGNSGTHSLIQMSILSQMKMKIVDMIIIWSHPPKSCCTIFACWNIQHPYFPMWLFKDPCTAAHRHALLQGTPGTCVPAHILFSPVHTAVGIFWEKVVISEYYFKVCLTNQNPS